MKLPNILPSLPSSTVPIWESTALFSGLFADHAAMQLAVDNSPRSKLHSDANQEIKHISRNVATASDVVRATKVALGSLITAQVPPLQSEKSTRSLLTALAPYISKEERKCLKANAMELYPETTTSVLDDVFEMLTDDSLKQKQSPDSVMDTIVALNVYNAAQKLQFYELKKAGIVGKHGYPSHPPKPIMVPPRLQRRYDELKVAAAKSKECVIIDRDKTGQPVFNKIPLPNFFHAIPHVCNTYMSNSIEFATGALLRAAINRATFIAASTFGLTRRATCAANTITHMDFELYNSHARQIERLVALPDPPLDGLGGRSRANSHQNTTPNTQGQMPRP